VFVGKATSQRAVASPSGERRVGQTTFEIEELWKGQPPDRNSIAVHTCSYTDATTGDGLLCSDEPRFTVGSRYVVFATGNPLVATGCGGSGSARIDLAEAALQWLATKPSTQVRTSR
jgi:hypothetical protein